MMKSIVSILVFLTPFITISQNKWELSYVFTDESLFLKKLEVIDSNYINLLFTSVSGWSSDNGHLYNSKNLGKSWELIDLVKPNTYIWSMSCPDTNNFYFGLRKKIYKSINKGAEINIIDIDTLAIYDVENIEMLNKDIGVAFYLSFLVTKDGWKTYKYEKYWQKNDSISFTFSLPHFKNDSIVNCIVGNARGKRGMYFCEYNINTFTYQLYWIGLDIGIWDMSIVDNHIYFCGESDVLNGGSSNDAIFKSSDSGKTWRRVLDLYSDDSKFNRADHQPPEFGLQSIAFKDSMTGIAVGQFGKIVYTYDGGESWIYESQLPDSLGEPATMKVRFAGSIPIIATYSGHIYRMIEDNLAPKAEDTITISGRVWEGDKGQPGIPIILGYRVTMTDSNGYYKFTRLKNGKYTVKALNKYFDRGNPKYYYKPFDYTPIHYELDLSSDTSGIDFNAIDLRTFYSVSGEIITTSGEGLKDIPLTIGDSSTISIEDGKFIFPRIEYHRTFDLIPYSKEYTFTPEKYTINIDNDLDTFRFVASPVTSVSEPISKVGKINIIPNPANNYIDIEFESEIFSPYFHIYNLMGIEIITDIIPANTKQHRINIEKLPAGIYYIKIGDNVERFVKM